MFKWIAPTIIFLVILLSGCVKENIPEPTPTTISEKVNTTTTIWELETTMEAPTPSTTIKTTTISKRCRFLNFQIRSHAYRNGKLKFYFENIGSEEIDDFDAILQFSNETLTETYVDQDIQYHTIRVYELVVGPGLENVTFVEKSCGKKYFIKV